MNITNVVFCRAIQFSQSDDRVSVWLFQLSGQLQREDSKLPSLLCIHDTYTYVYLHIMYLGIVYWYIHGNRNHIFEEQRQVRNVLYSGKSWWETTLANCWPVAKVFSLQFTEYSISVFYLLAICQSFLLQII